MSDYPASDMNGHPAEPDPPDDWPMAGETQAEQRLRVMHGAINEYGVMAMNLDEADEIAITLGREALALLREFDNPESGWIDRRRALLARGDA